MIDACPQSGFCVPRWSTEMRWAACTYARSSATKTRSMIAMVSCGQTCADKDGMTTSTRGGAPIIAEEEKWSLGPPGLEKGGGIPPPFAFSKKQEFS